MSRLSAANIRKPVHLVGLPGRLLTRHPTETTYRPVRCRSSGTVSTGRVGSHPFHEKILRTLPAVLGSQADSHSCVRGTLYCCIGGDPTNLAWIRYVGRFVHSIALLIWGNITDQRLALPSDSYLVDYFNALDAYLDVGPPVYFVTKNVDVTARHGQQQLCGRFTTCMELSAVSTIDAERKRPDSSFIATPPAPWIDDFLRWTDPALDTCCRVRRDDPSVFCTPRDSERRCKPCFEDHEPQWDITMQGLPEGPDVMRYIQQWLISPTNDECPLGGQASYGSALSLRPDNSSLEASHFRTFHSPLKTQDDFINALTAANRISGDIKAHTGVETFPYSLFYVFFEQV